MSLTAPRGFTFYDVQNGSLRCTKCGVLGYKMAVTSYTRGAEV